MTTTYELYTNENGTHKAVEGKAPAIIERVEALETSVESLEETLDKGVVTSVNGKTGVVSLDVGVTSFNGSKGAVTYSAPVSSVNGKTGAVTIDVGVTSVNGKTGAVTGLVRSVNGLTADPSGNVTVGHAMPDYSTGVSLTSGTTYTAQYDTLVITSASATVCDITVNGTSIHGMWDGAVSLFVRKGDAYKIMGSGKAYQVK